MLSWRQASRSRLPKQFAPDTRQSAGAISFLTAAKQQGNCPMPLANLAISRNTNHRLDDLRWPAPMTGRPRLGRRWHDARQRVA